MFRETLHRLFLLRARETLQNSAIKRRKLLESRPYADSCKVRSLVQLYRANCRRTQHANCLNLARGHEGPLHLLPLETDWAFSEQRARYLSSNFGNTPTRNNTLMRVLSSRAPSITPGDTPAKRRKKQKNKIEDAERRRSRSERERARANVTLR